MSAIRDRLEKNQKRLFGWAKQIPTDAWRLYDRDIPEFPCIIDRYGDYFVVWDKSDPVIDAGKNNVAETLQALQDIYKISPDKIVLKQRQRQEGLKQYERLDQQNQFMVVREGQAQLRVNLFDYLDTGLFLDHRPMRLRLRKEAKGKRMLNLFCYTGSVSVAAAIGGAQVTSVDMSATYLDWAQENFRLNSIETSSHKFIQDDVLQWLEQPAEPEFDLIFLDPPTFSNSKRMERDFEVEDDQEFLVNACMKRLLPNGVLYFSNNKRRFKISENLRAEYQIEDMTEATIPPDFHDQKIHRCFRVRFLSKP